jgi:hypothetical protein
MDSQTIIDSLLKRIEDLEEELKITYSYLSFISSDNKLKREDKGQLFRNGYQDEDGEYFSEGEAPDYSKIPTVV